MACSVKQTRQQSFFQRCLVSQLVICLLSLKGAEGQCSLPKGLRGWWKDSEKGLLTFTSDTVGRYNIYSFGEFTLSCYLQNSSTYIMESASFTLLGLNFTAYMCWSFVQQSNNLFHLYEHTEPNQQAGNEKVMMYLPVTTRVFDNICSNVTTTDYRLLRKRNEKDREGEVTIIIVVAVLVVAICLAALIAAFAIRWRRSRGMFQINDKPSDSKQQDKARTYQVDEPETDATSTPPAQPSFKKTTSPRMILEHGSKHHHNRHLSHTQGASHAMEDNTSEQASSHSSVSVTATSGFTSVSPSSSISASASVPASAATSGLPNQDVNSPMTPICSDKDDKQLVGSDQFTSVQFSLGQGSTSEADLCHND